MKTLIKTNRSLFPAIPSLLNDFLADDWFDSSLASWKSPGATLPAVNVSETNDDFLIDVAAPGMKRDDFKVELVDNVLTIVSQREDNPEQQDSNTKYIRKEFSYQAFQRSFSLPENKVEGNKIAARYIDGILHVTIPKKEEAKIKPAKQIKVS